MHGNVIANFNVRVAAVIYRRGAWIEHMSSIIKFVENKRQSGRNPLILIVSLMFLLQIFEQKFQIHLHFVNLFMTKRW